MEKDLSPLERELLKKYRQCDERAKKTIEETIDSQLEQTKKTRIYELREKGRKLKISIIKKKGD